MSKPVCFPFPQSRATPAQNWRETSKCDHFVQFYHTSDYLIECLSGFIADGLWNGDRAVVIATAEHRVALEERLRLKAVDVASAVITGQFVALDAKEMLSKFMVGRSPDPDAFSRVIGEVVERATTGRHLRAFGEMVALLWKDGNRQAAIELERLWNGLSQKHAFALFCAYPADCAAPGPEAISLQHICDSHSRVISMAG